MSTILLAMDFMVGIADQTYATTALGKAREAIDEARRCHMPVIFTKVGFRPGHPEVSSRNKVFGTLIGTDKLVGASSRLVDPMTPIGDEPVIDKKRFSAFAGNDLWTIVRASGATSLVLCGLSTSGVVLSTALELIDADFDVTVLSDACADPDTNVHQVILNDILGSRATVRTVDAWAADRGRNAS